MTRILTALLVLFSLGGQQDPIDPAIKEAVDRFFSTQVNEDVDGYMALWSRTAQKPQLQQLKYIFDSGDDEFADIQISRAIVRGTTAKVRVSAIRIRRATSAPNPDGTPRIFKTLLELGLTFVMEDGAWRLLREGSPQDELAAALLAADDANARAEMLKLESDIVNSRLVDAIGRRTDPLAQMNRYKEALSGYQRGLEVARAVPDRKSEGQMLQNIANTYYFLRDFPAALAHYEQRLALERGASNDEGIASALIGIATIRYSTFEYTAALALYREALAIQERLNDEGLVATTLTSTGNVLYLQGDFEGAIADYKRSEALKRKYYDFGGAAAALEGLGRTYAAQGDLGAALVAFSTVLEDSRKRRDTPRLASSLQNIGETHFRLGNLDAARVAFDESRQHYEKRNDLANAGRVLQGTAVTELLSARPAEGEAAYGKSIAACSAATPRPDNECIARALVGLAYAQAAQEHYDDAIPSYRKSIQAFEALKSPEMVGRAQVGLAEALSGKQDYLGALKEAENARRIAIVLESDDLLWRALVAQSRAERRLDRKTAALGAAKAAVSAVHAMAAAAVRRPAHAVGRDTATAFVNAAVLQAETGDEEAAWLSIEEMRTHVLRAALAVNERDISPGMTEDDRAVELKLATGLSALLVQRDRQKELPKRDEAQLARLEKSILQAAEKRNAAQDALFQRLPQLRTWRGLGAAATLDEIKAAVAPGTRFVQFVVDDRDLLILAAERNAESVVLTARLVPVKRQELAEKIAHAIDPAALADAETWRRASADLVKLFPPGVLASPGASGRLVVMPDDVLWRVPFEALPLGTGYLGDEARVSYAQSITSLVRPPPLSPTAAPLHVLAVAAPDLAPAMVETLKTTAPSWILRAADAAEAEATRIRAVVPDASTVLLKAEATEEAVRAAAAQASVVHLAAPFRLNAASPLFSSVLLSAPAGQGTVSSNGILEARELPDMAPPSRLTVFSDAASLSMRDAGAAVPILHWVWRAAGTETILVRRWASDESQSLEMLATFYEALRGGSSAAEALRAARTAARTQGAPPQVWAGWLLVSGRFSADTGPGKSPAREGSRPRF